MQKLQRRHTFATKQDMLAGGDLVEALTYSRASQDKRHTGKSVGDQDKLNLGEVRSHRWTLARPFSDNDKSASRHARGDREQWLDLIATIRRGVGHVLVMWELARGQRDLTVYTMIRDTCVDSGLFYWLVGGQLYDLRDRNDRMVLGMQAVQAEYQSDAIRENVLRGIQGSADAGRPHARTTYGYRRIYDQRSGDFVRQEFDEEPRTAANVDGGVTDYTRAGVVRRLYAELLAGVPLSEIARRINDSGIPTPGADLQRRKKPRPADAPPPRWNRSALRDILRNPAYIGKRVLNGKIHADGKWEPLVSAETYWAAVNLLSDPARKTTRPSRAKYLLSYLAKCGECGGSVQASKVQPRRGDAYMTYRCLDKRCVATLLAALDEYVQVRVLKWLAETDLLAVLTAGNSAGHLEARGEAERLRAKLEQEREALDDPLADVPLSFYRREAALLKAISEAEERGRHALPPTMRWLGEPDPVGAWLRMDLPARREFVRLALDIRLRSAGGPGRHGVPLSERVELTWLLGTEASAEVMRAAA